jgi:carbonic anhydrase
VTTGFDDLLAANRTYAERFTSAGLKGRAAKGLAVVTCMDSRIEPLQMLGLSKGDAKILRNAGARVTDDVLRTLVLAVHLLGVDRVMVVAHTECRMATVSDEQVHAAIRESAGIDTRSLEFRHHGRPGRRAGRRRPAHPELAVPAGRPARARVQVRRGDRSVEVLVPRPDAGPGQPLRVRAPAHDPLRRPARDALDLAARLRGRPSV